MRHHQHVIEPAYPPNLSMIDGDFDKFELNLDLEPNLREAETATFYHDALDSME